MRCLGGLLRILPVGSLLIGVVRSRRHETLGSIGFWPATSRELVNERSLAVMAFVLFVLSHRGLIQLIN